MKFDRLIQCIDCPGFLVQSKSNFQCIKCKRKYPYKNGVLNLLGEKDFIVKENIHQKSYYDKEYSSKYADTQLEWRNRYISRLTKYLPRNKKSLILDVACGHGYMSIAVAKLGYRVIASEISTEGILQAYRYAKMHNVHRNILFIAGDVNKITFKKFIFAFFILLHVIEDIPNDKQLIKKLLLCSRNNAMFYIGVPLAVRYLFPPLIPFYLFSDYKVGHKRRYALNNIISLFNSKSRCIDAIYTGHLIKFVGIILQKIGIKRYENYIEDLDEKYIRFPLWASNLTAVFRIRK